MSDTTTVNEPCPLCGSETTVERNASGNGFNRRPATSTPYGDTKAIEIERVVSRDLLGLLKQLCEVPTMQAGYDLLADWCTQCGNPEPVALKVGASPDLGSLCQRLADAWRRIDAEGPPRVGGDGALLPDANDDLNEAMDDLCERFPDPATGETIPQALMQEGELDDAARARIDAAWEAHKAASPPTPSPADAGVREALEKAFQPHAACDNANGYGLCIDCEGDGYCKEARKLADAALSLHSPPAPTPGEGA